MMDIHFEGEFLQQLNSLDQAIDITRGAPHASLLDRCQQEISPIIKASLASPWIADGVDCRNYGAPRGLPSAIKIGAELMNCPQDHVIIGPNSSLNLLFQYLTLVWFQGTSNTPAWQHLTNPAILCTTPGYDRHFNMLDSMGIEMIPVAIGLDGPDQQDLAHKLSQHTNIIGLIGVPRHSNPGGEVWSDAVMSSTLAQLAAYDDHCQLILDCAYSVHDFAPTPDQASTFQLAQQHAMQARLVQVASTAKITFAGGGISAIGLHPDNAKKLLAFQAGISMGGNKVNQMWHAQLFEKFGGVESYFAQTIRPFMAKRFGLVQEQLEQSFKHSNHIKFTEPTGGYFVLLQFPQGTASAIVEACSPWVKLTQAGATHPLGLDPQDAFIRLAPTVVSEKELLMALKVLETASEQVIAQSNSSRTV